jgi:predicted Rossmann-fold nucleotide-binding protein
MKPKILLLAMCTGASLVFLGCATKCTKCSMRAPPRTADSFFPSPPDSLPFHPFRTNVYTAGELLAECATNFDTNAADRVYRSTLDWQCYTNAMDQGSHRKRTDLSEMTLRYLRLHDLAIEEALDKYLKPDRNHPAGWKGVVGIMGGHELPRQEKLTNNADAPYMQVALMAQRLASNRFTIATAGGPGAMEAGNLGAWFANRSEGQLRQAVRILTNVSALSTNTTTGEWLVPAFKVIHEFPRTNDDPRTESVGVPTWFYGHEPPNPFATHIAKYFENSLREEHVLAISTRGVIFAPGSAGTVQEIFQDACQNYYTNYTARRFSMVLFDADYWNPGTNSMVTSNGVPIPVWPALQTIAKGKFDNLLMVTNDINAIVEFIIAKSRP